MTHLTLDTEIKATTQIAFDVARDVTVHTESMSRSGERVVGAHLTGLLNLGDLVTFEGRHFGKNWRLSARIAQLESPSYFVDVMEKGPFRTWSHRHAFRELNAGATVMSDTVDYDVPLGFIGRIVDSLVLRRHLTRLLSIRADYIRKIAEQRGL
jgi:ligand-binding SRPBCC domain-containing protein